MQFIIEMVITMAIAIAVATASAWPILQVSKVLILGVSDIWYLGFRFFRFRYQLCDTVDTCWKCNHSNTGWPHIFLSVPWPEVATSSISHRIYHLWNNYLWPHTAFTTLDVSCPLTTKYFKRKRKSPLTRKSPRAYKIGRASCRERV